MKIRPVALFILRGDPDSLKAYDMVRTHLEKGTFVVRICPPSMADDYTIPFITNEEQSPFYGLEGVQYFLDHPEKRVSVLAAA